MTSKISILQRQAAFQASAINNEHKLVEGCKDSIKWLKGVPFIVSSQARLDELYKCIEASKKRIAKLVEIQVFTKQRLQEAYKMAALARRFRQYDEGKHCYKPETQHKSWNFKHVPRWPFMAEAPAAEVGSVVEDEVESPVTPKQKCKHEWEVVSRSMADSKYKCTLCGEEDWR